MRLIIWILLSWLLLYLNAVSGTLEYEVLWEVKSEPGFSGPNELRNTKTGKTIGIVASEVGKGVVCFNSQGKRLWDYDLSGQVTSYPAVGDVDGDNVEDIVACGGSGEIVAINKNGNLIWTAQTAAHVMAESCPAICDLDNDGQPEILVGDTGGYLSCFDNKGILLWRFRGEGSQIGPTLCADIYPIPGKEIIFTSHDGHIYALSARGEWIWDIYQRDDLFPNSTPILADVNGDKRPELYIGGGLHHFYQIDLETATINLKENTLLHVNSAIAASDIDGDGKDEIIFGNKGGTARCFDESGFIWKQEFLKGNMSFAPIIVNLDNDSNLEILFLYRTIHAIDTDGKILMEKELSGAFNSPALAGDFNDDGKLEIILTGYGVFGGNNIVCLQWNVPYNKTNNDWTVFSGSRSHAGFHHPERSFTRYNFPDKIKKITSEFTLREENLQILTGKNTWRFDIKNPASKRLVLLSHLRFPDGSFQHFVHHIHATKERVSLPLSIKTPGDYELRQELIDADARIILDSKNQIIAYEGITSDKKFLQNTYQDIMNISELWKGTNPLIASEIHSEVLSLKGQLIALENEDESQIIEYLPDVIHKSRRLLTLSKAGQVLSPNGSFIAWEYCPWAFFDAKETLPTPADSLEQLSVNLCIGEYESVALNLTNLSSKNQVIRVSPKASKGSDKFSFEKHLHFRRAVEVSTVRREQIFDALPKLDEANLISIPAMESQQLWITINAGDLPPGEYIVEIKLVNLETVPSTVTVPLRISVYDLALPRPRPLRFCVWAYAADWPEYKLNDLNDHGVTVHFGTPPQAICNKDGVIEEPIDFSKHDASVKRLAQDRFLLFVGPQHKVKGQPFLSDQWKKAFIRYLRQWVLHMSQLGLDYRDWAIYPYDEPSTPYALTTINLVKIAKLIREADPNILIYTDPTSGTNEKTLEMLKDLIDIWCPSSELLERFGDKILPFAKKYGKEVWFYDAAGKSKTLSPLGIYRWRFWYAWNLGLTGAGWWTYSHGDFDWEGPNELGDYWATIYKSPTAIVTSKRWEVSREGIEDFEILYLLRESIKRAKISGYSGPELREAENVLNTIPVSIEKKLLGIGRRIPLNMDGVPHYTIMTSALQEARKKIVTNCMRLNNALK